LWWLRGKDSPVDFEWLAGFFLSAALRCRTLGKKRGAKKMTAFRCAAIASMLFFPSIAAGQFSRRDMQGIANATNASRDRSAAAEYRKAVINLAAATDKDRELADILLKRLPGKSKRRSSKKAIAAGFRIPALAPPFKVGDVGPLPYTIINVLQVHGPKEFRAGVPQLIGADVQVLFRGVSSAGMTDGTGHPISGAFEVVGTETLATVRGGSRTVFVLSPFDTEPAERLFNEAIAKESPEKKAAAAPVTAATSPDARAKALLSNARSLAKAGLYAAAEKKFRQIIAESPGSSSAEQAQKELDSLPSH
jgi:hypothetical protein